MHLASNPVLLGSGENLLAGINATALGYKCVEYVTKPKVLHVVLAKQQ